MSSTYENPFRRASATTSTNSAPAIIIKPIQPDSNDARLAFQASEDTLRAALHGVDPDGITANNNNNQQRRSSGSSTASSSHHHHDNNIGIVQNNNNNNNAADGGAGSYPVSWQLSAVREELAETRNIASRLRRQIGARDSDCAVFEARIVDAGKRRKEIEEQITEQLKRRSKITHLTNTTERQKQKIGIHPAATTTTTTTLGRPLGVEKKSSSGSGSPSRGTNRSSSSSARQQQQQQDQNDFDLHTANRDDEIRFELEEQEHDREMAELRYRHRMFREEIIKWQKKRRILENSSLKMSVQAEDEKFFDADNVRQRKAEKKLLQSAENIRDISKGERDHLESQNREVGKHLGALKMRVREAEEELAGKRRTMEGLRREATRIQKSVVQARQDTAQSVIQAQEALERVRFEENKALRDAQQRQRDAADRARSAGMNALGVVDGNGEKIFSSQNLAAASANKATTLPVPARVVPSSSNQQTFAYPPLPSEDDDDDHHDKTEQKRETVVERKTKKNNDDDEEEEVKFSIVEKTSVTPVVPVSPPRKLPVHAGNAIGAPSGKSPNNNYQQFLHQFHQNDQQRSSTAVCGGRPQNSNENAFAATTLRTSPNNNNNNNNNNNQNVPQNRTQNNVSDHSHNYRVYNSEEDDPRDAWFTLAPRDGATSDELYNELTRIVRTVAVEFGRPQLELLDGLQQE